MSGEHIEGHDLQGRRYLTVVETKTGQHIKFDDGFTCIGKGAKRMIHDAGGDGLYFYFTVGKHFLGGQISEDGACFIGVYLADKGEV